MWITDKCEVGLSLYKNQLASLRLYDIVHAICNKCCINISVQFNVIGYYCNKWPDVDCKVLTRIFKQNMSLKYFDKLFTFCNSSYMYSDKSPIVVMECTWSNFGNR